MLNGLSLRIENGALRHDPDVCFHAGIIAERPAREGRYNARDFWEGTNAKAWSKLIWIREASSDSERPMRWALLYSAARSVWNMVGSSVERVTGIPWRRSLGRGWDSMDTFCWASWRERAPVRTLLAGQSSRGMRRSARRSI